MPLAEHEGDEGIPSLFSPLMREGDDKLRDEGWKLRCVEKDAETSSS
jgi:hypothetical protein